jgi:hypothetical protein
MVVFLTYTTDSAFDVSATNDHNFVHTQCLCNSWCSGFHCCGRDSIYHIIMEKDA